MKVQALKFFLKSELNKVMDSSIGLTSVLFAVCKDQYTVMEIREQGVCQGRDRLHGVG
jgi:hypothetical protein